MCRLCHAVVTIDAAVATVFQWWYLFWHTHTTNPVSEMPKRYAERLLFPVCCKVRASAAIITIHQFITTKSYCERIQEKSERGFECEINKSPISFTNRICFYWATRNGWQMKLVGGKQQQFFATFFPIKHVDVSIQDTTNATILFFHKKGTNS